LDLYDEEITKDAFGKTIRAKTMGQRLYINAMKRNDVKTILFTVPFLNCFAA
jgi:phosphate starvation-inducible PhoH-like protein